MEYDLAWPLARKLIETLASYMERRGYWIEWRVVLEQAIETSQRVRDVAGETTTTALLARLSQRQSRGEDVVRYYRRVLRLAKQSDNQFEFARACSNLGFYYIDFGLWWRSEVLTLRALEIFEILKSNHGRAHTHNHLGLLYLRQERWHEARDNLSAACSIWSEIGDNHSLRSGYINLGLLELELNNSEFAIGNLLKAHKTLGTTGDKSSLAKISHNIAIAYFQLLNWTEAEKYALEAEKGFNESADEQGVADVFQTLGAIYMHTGQEDLAIEHFTQSLAVHKKHGNKDRELRVRNAIKDLAALSRGNNTARLLKNLSMLD